MFEGWGEFYLMAGSAAAVLIGLIFVVISLMQDRSRSSVLSGSKLYMGPIVLGVSFALTLSATALVPHIGGREVAAIAGIIALWGLARGLMSIVGIRALKDGVHWTDFWFYGVAPSIIYVGLLGIAWGTAIGAVWAEEGTAAVVLSLLLLAVRNEWDLITWIAPRGDASDLSEPE